MMKKKYKYKFTKNIIFWGADTLMRAFISIIILYNLILMEFTYSQTILFRIASVIWIIEGITKLIKKDLPSN